MSIQVSDLPPSARETLLDQIRTQVGEHEYQQAIDTVGEDAVLEAALKQMGLDASDSEEKSGGGWVQGVLIFVGWMLAMGAIAGLGLLIGGRVGWCLIGVACGMLIGFWYSVAGWLFGAILGGAVGGAIGVDSSTAFGGAFVGGFVGLGIHLLLAWVIKATTEMTRTLRL